MHESHVVSAFRAGRGLEGPAQEAAREAAHAYATTVSSIGELTILRSLDTGEKMEQRDLVRAMAKRVGLEAPPAFGEEDAAQQSQSRSE